MYYEEKEIAELLNRSDLACMRAICAVFRNQTGYEKGCAATVNKNGLGFRANHAKAGTLLALEMTSGNHDGVMRQVVDGFMTYRGQSVPKIIVCREISKYYVEQLTSIANKMEQGKRDSRDCSEHEELSYGKYEREDSYYSRNYNDYHIYDTCPC